MSWIAAGVVAAGAITKGVHSASVATRQNRAAKRLKMSSFTKDYMANRDLAMNQAYSRRSPGAAFAEEQVRRNTANQVGNAMRLAGGDVNKIAAISSAANAQANDATARIQAQGDAFSEQAFNRLDRANNDVARGRLRWRAERNALKSSAQQNWRRAIGDFTDAGGAIAGAMGGGGKNSGGGYMSGGGMSMFGGGRTE